MKVFLVLGAANGDDPSCELGVGEVPDGTKFRRIEKLPLPMELATRLKQYLLTVRQESVADSKLKAELTRLRKQNRELERRLEAREAGEPEPMVDGV